ncbi:MAG TPA: orotidine-5'-phosphate decarboxylase [Pyrinomonadaceae bacterium]|nr:orotidine-5'-phosphate decarboxylase [Pyrinomonadaceae bacterium]
MQTAKRVIVALDVDRADVARGIVAELKGEAAAFKIGLQLFTAAGPQFVRELAQESKIFLDLKFHDIPTTVANAGIEAARLGVWMFNVHASGGREMMQRTVGGVSEVCERESLKRPLIIGVTVLTSSDENTLRETGVDAAADEHVIRLAHLTAESGLNGVVASPRETSGIRNAIGRDDFIVVTPGVRPSSATNDDQKRVMTPGRAAAEGASYLVVGRPIVRAGDRLLALTEIQKEIDETVAA